jgi:hypothetical protein
VRPLTRLLPALLALAFAPAAFAQPGAPAPTAPPPAAPQPPVAGQPGPTVPPLSPGAPMRPRVAIPEFVLEGEGAAPAMAMQLQDGFVLGLVLGGIDVLDGRDVKKRLHGKPELESCETSPCLKQLGEVLAVRFVLRVRVGVTGNSYRMTARLFSTEGAAPAALPVAAQSRACDVCTVAEAREHMMRLADAVRAPIEERPGPPSSAPPPSPRTSLAMPLVALGVSIAAVAGGTALVMIARDGDKTATALGAALAGAGAASACVSAYVAIERHGRRTSAGVQLALRF